jgi:hypothetical protein
MSASTGPTCHVRHVRETCDARDTRLLSLLRLERMARSLNFRDHQLRMPHPSPALGRMKATNASGSRIHPAPCHLPGCVIPKSRVLTSGTRDPAWTTPAPCSSVTDKPSRFGKQSEALHARSLRRLRSADVRDDAIVKWAESCAPYLAHASLFRSELISAVISGIFTSPMCFDATRPSQPMMKLIGSPRIPP